MDPIWLKSYSAAVPAEIDYHGETLQDLFFEAEAKFSDRPAFNFMEKTLSYKEFSVLAKQFANFCRYELKLKKGDRFAVMLPNVFQYPIAVFGATLAGLTLVNLNPLDKGTSLQHEICDSGAKVIIVLENFAKDLMPIIENTEVEHVIVTSAGDLQPFIKAFFINFYLRYLKRAVPKFHFPGQIRFLEALRLGAQHEFSTVSVDAKDLAFIQYTGGTTGISKGVKLSHQNLMCNVLQCHAWIKDDLVLGQEIIITALPLYHVFSLMVNALVFMKLGGMSVLIIDPRHLSTLIRTLKRSHFTCITGVNTLFNALMHQAKFRTLDFSQLKVTIAGGMPVQKAVADEWQALTKCVISEGYGLSEASPVVCINPLSAKNFNGSVGFPISSTLVSIRDTEGHELLQGETGELWVHGPQVMSGYWHNDAETAKVLTHDGWLKTGDVAYIDAQGFVFVVDRLKDMLIVSGFKVYPVEVEDLLKTLPGVNEVAIIGVPSDLHGERVKAVIVKETGSALTKDTVIKFCHEHLVAYKCPHEVEFVDALPKSTVGKILKRELMPI